MVRSNSANTHSIANRGIGEYPGGYGVALISQIIAFPLYGLEVRIGRNIQIGLIFTAVPPGRSYIIRRIFNK
jgi:hypothetical protein